MRWSPDPSQTNSLNPDTPFSIIIYFVTKTFFCLVESQFANTEIIMISDTDEWRDSIIENRVWKLSHALEPDQTCLECVTEVEKGKNPLQTHLTMQEFSISYLFCSTPSMQRVSVLLSHFLEIFSKAAKSVSLGFIKG